MTKPSFFETRIGHAVETALMIAPTLAVLLLSAIFCFLTEASGVRLSGGFPLVLGVLTLASLIASTALGLARERPLVPALFAVLLWLCFISRWIILASGTSDPAEDAFFQMILLIFSFPAFSFQAVSELFPDAGAASLVVTALLALLNTAAAVIPIAIARKKGR